MNSLAFAGFGQTKAYYSDSGPSTADRRNVRDGHYVIWGYEHMIATVDSTGAFTNPKAANFIGWINGTKTDPSFDAVQVEGAAGTIPTCAMSVQRATDGGAALLLRADRHLQLRVRGGHHQDDAGELRRVHRHRHQHLHWRHELPPRLLRVKGILNMS